MLTAYINATTRLLQNPVAPTSLYATADITTWINTARYQMAGEESCVRVLATQNTAVGQVSYPFSGLNIGTPATTGIQSVINVRRINYASGNGQRQLVARAWEWFDYYHLNNPVPSSGPPTTWSQYAQGAAPNVPSIGGASTTGPGGTFYIDPSPDDIYALTCDCAALPQPLAADTDVEAIPYPWTDAVPYLAAWYALLSSQTNARVADAERMYNYYTEFRDRARKASNPPVLGYQYERAPDIAHGAKFNIKPSAGGQ